ncbi:MAG: PID-CTERM protein-sorting domain-containing protein [Janthinobacterium lividum]
MLLFSSRFSALRHVALAAALLLAGTRTAQAQAGAPGNVSGNGSTGGPPSPQAVTAVPLDGGASLLAASGVAFALKRLRKRRAR